MCGTLCTHKTANRLLTIKNKSFKILHCKSRHMWVDLFDLLWWKKQEVCKQMFFFYLWSISSRSIAKSTLGLSDFQNWWEPGYSQLQMRISETDEKVLFIYIFWDIFKDCNITLLTFITNNSCFRKVIDVLKKCWILRLFDFRWKILKFGSQQVWTQKLQVFQFFCFVLIFQSF